MKVGVMSWDGRDFVRDFINNSTQSSQHVAANFAVYANRQDINRFLALHELFKLQLPVKGSIVECGVFGGSSLFTFAHLSGIYEPSNYHRKIIGFDTFEGMVEPTFYDVNYNNKSAKKMFDEHVEKKIDFAMCSLEDVKKNIRENTNINNIFLIKGKVENTLRNIKKLPKKISILRLDTDFYESTKIELEVLFPRLVKGGVLIIDDYGFWKGAKKAVDEYFSDYRQFFHYIDHSCRLLIKK